MDETLKKELRESIDNSVKSLETSLKEEIVKELGPIMADAVEKRVTEMRLDRLMTGKDISGVSEAKKLELVEEMRAFMRDEKAAHFAYSDQTGGYLISPEVYDGILRIAQVSGLVARDARKFTISSDELEIPRYTGSTLQGEYLGEDTEGNETQVDIGVARLFIKNWQMIFRFSNNLLADARVDFADWVMALAAEGLAYRLDREGFMGGTYTGSPFVGLLATNSDVPVHTMATGATGFGSFGANEASDTIGEVATSVVKGAAFYFHRSVWAKIRQRNTSGVYEFGTANANFTGLKKEDGIQAVGEIWGYPVYTSDVLPAYSASAVSTKFGVFGDLSQMLAWADKGPMSILKSEHATVGGKSVFRANQTAFRLNHRHSVGQLLPSAGVVLKTAAS